MNKERLAEMAARLRGPVKEYPDGKKFGFNMATWCFQTSGFADGFRGRQRRHDCNTVACNAGWAVYMFGSAEEIAKMQRENERAEFIARRLLDLTQAQTTSLFYPWHGPKRYGLPRDVNTHEITPHQSAEAIEKMIAKNGVADWSHVPAPEED